MDGNLENLYFAIEKSLIEASERATEEVKAEIEGWGHEERLPDDQAYFQALVTAIFHGSGIKATQLEPVLKKMFTETVFEDYRRVITLSEAERNVLCKKQNIGYKKSLNNAFKSSVIFSQLLEKNGSFQKYLDSFTETNSLKADLRRKFAGIGPKSSLHFLMMCGYPTIKPDRVIGRIFNRLGLVEDPNDLAKICAVGDEIAKKTGFNHKRIDIVLVKYGAEGFSEIFGLTDGVCSETAPKCDRCYARSYCKYTL
tara:strand:- start:292 stop:1056 length:765 start_codon:yes stop_codon:yes gene_type:complete